MFVHAYMGRAFKCINKMANTEFLVCCSMENNQNIALWFPDDTQSL